MRQLESKWSYLGVSAAARRAPHVLFGRESRSSNAKPHVLVLNIYAMEGALDLL